MDVCVVVVLITMGALEEAIEEKEEEESLGSFGAPVCWGVKKGRVEK